MEPEKLSRIVEAALLAAGRPLSTRDLVALFADNERPEANELEDALVQLSARCADSPLELVQVASGHRLQVRRDYAPWVSRLWEERSPRYSRALLETLSIIAYRQPVTRGDIEDIRGVATSSTIIRTLLERRWIRVVGNRDVPGRPSLYGTTRDFLDYFGLRGLSDLPELEEIRDLDQINVELDFDAPPAGDDGEATGQGSASREADEQSEGAASHPVPASSAGGHGAAKPGPTLATVTPIRPGALIAQLPDAVHNDAGGAASADAPAAPERSGDAAPDAGDDEQAADNAEKEGTAENSVEDVAPEDVAPTDVTPSDVTPRDVTPTEAGRPQHGDPSRSDDDPSGDTSPQERPGEADGRAAADAAPGEADEVSGSRPERGNDR